MYHQYMISRAFIPPWSLAMRDRKLLDQTLPEKAIGTLVSPSTWLYDRATEKSRKSSAQQMGQQERRGMRAKGGRAGNVTR